LASKAAGQDFVVPPSGAEWWMKDGTPLDEARQEEWRWEFEIPLPPWTRAEDIEEAKEAWCAKKKRAIGSLPAMRYRKIAARQIGRILHIGPYNEAEEWWARLQEHISAHKMRSEGNTHEIYLNDPERVAPEMIKTILWCEVVTVA